MTTKQDSLTDDDVDVKVLDTSDHEVLDDLEDIDDYDDVDDVDDVDDDPDKAAKPKKSAARKAAKKRTSPLRRGLGRLRRHWLPTVLSVLLAASIALAATVYLTQFRPDQQTDAAAKQAAMNAASQGTVALLSYSPETLDQDFTSAKSHLTGDFLSYYSQFTQQIVSPAAKQRGVKATATVVRSAVSEMHPDSAVVLLYINQSTTSTDRPEPSLTASRVLVTLAKVDGEWRISRFDPV